MFNTFEEEYDWIKSQNCVFRTHIVKNASAHLGMAHLKTEGTLIKSIHCTAVEPNDFDPLNPKYADDLNPLTRYSMNKRRRWEIEDDVGEEMLEDVQSFHNNVPDEILYLERVNLTTFEWKDLPYVTFPKYFLINNFHSLKKSSDTNVYKFSKLNSIYGQTYSNFVRNNGKSNKENVKETENSTVVVYNVIRAPKNYLVLKESHFVASNFGARWPYYAYQKRKANWKEFEEDINDGIWKYYNNIDNDNSIENDNQEESDGLETTRKTEYYDLYSHLTDNFVFVKRRNNK